MIVGNTSKLLVIRRTNSMMLCNNPAQKDWFDSSTDSFETIGKVVKN